jgi:hypothetical protein
MDRDDAKALSIICVLACLATFVIGAVVGKVATISQIRTEMIQKEIGSWAITKTGERYFASPIELLK